MTTPESVAGTRRLRLAAAAILLSIFPLNAPAQIQTDVPALKDVYAGDFSIGCLLSYRHIGFASDPVVPGQSSVVDTNGGYLIRYHMNCMSPGNNMKAENTLDIAASAAAWAAAATDAERDSVSAHPVVRFNPDMIAQLDWAARQGFTFRGHTLVWHNQTPAAFFRTGYQAAGTRLTKEQMTGRMNGYIGGIIRLLHEGWPGLLSAMDVVNEAVNDNGTFRASGNEWYATFGDTTYVMKAFELARTWTAFYGETQIKLYYNDYSTHLAAKADGIVRLCRPIFLAGYLDGIGMQDHDNTAIPTAAAWIASYNRFDTVCSEMSVTEFDVATGSSSPSPALLAAQANQYGQLFKCFVERSARSGRGKLVNVSKDGLNDQYTFVTNQSSSLWTAQDQCKPAFFAVVGVGRGYNELDSLVSQADTLHEAYYTPDSWAAFAAALDSAVNARDRNYSNSVSADTALNAAADLLAAAIDGLVPGASAAGEPGGPIPRTFALGQNYPNPFNPSTRIDFTIPAASRITLRVYDRLGRTVATLADGLRPAGAYTVAFDAGDLAAGVYFYRLTAGERALAKKLVVLK